MEAEKALKEAEGWLESAKNMLQKADSSEIYTVVVAECIHSIIRANDALTLKFKEERAEKHEEAIHLFKELIKQKLIPPEEARFTAILTKAIHNKSAYDYGGKWTSKTDAEYWILYTGRFVLMAKKYVK